MTQNARRLFGLLPVVAAAAFLALSLTRGAERGTAPEPMDGASAASGSASPGVDRAGNMERQTFVQASRSSGAKDVDQDVAAPVELGEDDAPGSPPPGARVHPALIARLHGPAPLDRRHPSMARAIEIQERHLELLENPAVVGTAVGLNGKGEIALLVYTKAPARGIPATIEDLPVAVWHTGEIVSRDESTRAVARATSTATTQRFERAVPIGVSTGHPAITAGTLGCRVKSVTQVFALSNNHVYANENLAAIGDGVLQPGSYDQGVAPTDGIGTLFDYQPIVFGGSPVNPKNEIDAAIALTTPEQVGTGTPSGLGYGTPSSIPALAVVGASVTKVGRTTGSTTGTVSGINTMIGVSYTAGVARFKNQITIGSGTFSAGGDSGSLIVSNDGNRNPVGLLFAGSSSATIANEIGKVLARFSVTVDSTEVNEAPSVTIVSPADKASFATGATVTFTGTATDREDGDRTASLVWTSDLDGPLLHTSTGVTLNPGVHTITATASDSAMPARTGSVSIKVIVGGATASTVSASSVDYATEGGKQGNRNLLVTVALQDNLGDPVGGASVTIALSSPNGLLTGTATTGAGGTVTFSLRNAPSGTYSTLVTAVTASGLEWDGQTPANSFTK